MIDLNKIVLDEWKLLREIGHGKHGTVYEAQNINDETIAAIKIISLPNDEMMEYAFEEYGDNRSAIANFVREVAENFGNEIESMRMLKNIPYAIKLYDNRCEQTTWIDKNGMAQSGQNVIIVMEYAQPMKQFFKERPLCVKDVIDFACDIALGLQECQKFNIIHRDIKEDNLFIGFDGYGKIGDFGVASMNDTGLGSTMGMGTPYYMAPEVYNAAGGRCDAYDNTVDIYSLGIVLFKLLNGNRFPLAEDGMASAKAALDRRMKGEKLPNPRYANNELGNIVRMCCAYTPQERFRSGADLYNALKSVRGKMSEAELNQTLPYMTNPKPLPTPPLPYLSPMPFPKPTPEPIREPRTDILEKTVDILRGLSKTIAPVFKGLVQVLTESQKEVAVQKQRKKQRLSIAILTGFAVVFLVILLVFMYPKTATFYSDQSDNGRIHVKFLLLPDKRKSDMAASYLTVDNNWLYFSNPDEDHKLYRMSIWSDKTELICDDDCEYDILIGDYIYFTSYDEGEYLCRIKKDGTGKQFVLNYACRDLKRNGNNIMFVLADTGELKELDTSTIQ